MKFKPDPRILDDIARVAGGAVNIVSGLQQQIHDDIRTRMDDMADRMDLVTRDDYDRLAATVDALRARIEVLEAKAGVKAPAKKAKAAPKKRPTQKTTKKTTKKSKK